MFATIPLGLFILLIIGMIATILITMNDDANKAFLSLMIPLTLALFALTGTLICGYAKPDLERKHEVEILLSVEANAENISKAQKYNDSINKNNNLWCRFTIEDGSEYFIDIDYYINKQFLDIKKDTDKCVPVFEGNYTDHDSEVITEF